MMDESTRLDPTICPSCEHLLDAARSLNGAATPSRGDLTICAYCRTVLVFTAELGLRRADREEREEFKRRMAIIGRRGR